MMWSPGSKPTRERMTWPSPPLGSSDCAPEASGQSTAERNKLAGRQQMQCNATRSRGHRSSEILNCSAITHISFIWMDWKAELHRKHTWQSSMMTDLITCITCPAIPLSRGVRTRTHDLDSRLHYSNLHIRLHTEPHSIQLVILTPLLRRRMEKHSRLYRDRAPDCRLHGTDSSETIAHRTPNSGRRHPSRPSRRRAVVV